MTGHTPMHRTDSVDSRSQCPDQRPWQPPRHERRIAKEQKKLALHRPQHRQPGGKTCTHSLPVAGSMDQPHPRQAHRSDEPGHGSAIRARYHDHPAFRRHSRRDERVPKQRPGPQSG
jgi:hypothetical protein